MLLQPGCNVGFVHWVSPCMLQCFSYIGRRPDAVVGDRFPVKGVCDNFAIGGILSMSLF